MKENHVVSPLNGPLNGRGESVINGKEVNVIR